MTPLMAAGQVVMIWLASRCRSLPRLLPKLRRLWVVALVGVIGCMTSPMRWYQDETAGSVASLQPP